MKIDRAEFQETARVILMSLILLIQKGLPKMLKCVLADDRFMLWDFEYLGPAA